ncbi:hypothetical protein U4P99_03205 [Klebsiella pneumoniae]
MEKRLETVVNVIMFLSLLATAWIYTEGNIMYRDSWISRWCIISPGSKLYHLKRGASCGAACLIHPPSSLR